MAWRRRAKSAPPKPAHVAPGSSRSRPTPMARTAIESYLAAASAGIPYDLVLMDVHMPDMDGLEATRQIRAAEAGARRTRVVALTANAYGEDRDRIVSGGGERRHSLRPRADGRTHARHGWPGGDAPNPRRRSRRTSHPGRRAHGQRLWRGPRSNRIWRRRAPAFPTTSC